MLGGFNYWLLFKHTKGWLFEMTSTFFGIGGSITNQLNPILYHHHPLWSTVSQSHCIAIRPPSYPHKFVGSIMNVPHQTQEIPIKCRKMFWWTRKKNVYKESISFTSNFLTNQQNQQMHIAYLRWNKEDFNQKSWKWCPLVPVYQLYI